MTIKYLKYLNSEFGTFPASISLYSKVSSALSRLQTTMLN